MGTAIQSGSAVNEAVANRTLVEHMPLNICCCICRLTDADRTPSARLASRQLAATPCETWTGPPTRSVLPIEPLRELE
jgi:hypothetical protein